MYILFQAIVLLLPSNTKTPTRPVQVEYMLAGTNFLEKNLSYNKRIKTNLYSP